MEKSFMTVDEVAEELKVSKSYAYKVVRELNAEMQELGYLTVEYTGMYGEVTMEAVKAFQKANGLTATGEADAETLTVLYSAEAKAADGAEATATPEPESETSTAEGTVTTHEDA